MRELYPEIEPFATGRLAVSKVHTIHHEQCGNPDGKPIVFLHGGPGGGLEATYRRFFDPATYRIIGFDQRGCGRSTPYASLEDNTTWHLVDDIECLRKELGIDAWIVFGGSWGSALSLAYAEKHPERVKALVLRGIFLLRAQELRWFYQEGASFIYPDAWQHYVAPIPEDERDHLLEAFYRRLTSDDGAVRLAAARAWSVWEGSTSKLSQDPNLVAHFADDAFAEAFARIECHYFNHGGFFESPDQLLDGVDRIRHIPSVIVQGRYDVVCPMLTAWELHERWPEAEFHVVGDAGHAASEPGIAHHLVEATDRFRSL